MDRTTIVSFKSMEKPEILCIEKSNQICDDLDRRLQISVTSTKEGLYRSLLYTDLKYLNLFFNKRANFIMDCISTIKSDSLDILYVLTRGLIDAYCQLLHLQNIDRSKIIATIAFKYFKTMPLSSENRDLINIIDRNISICDTSFPKYDVFSKIYSDFLRGEGKEFKKLLKQYDSPSARHIIKKLHNENLIPKIRKDKILYFWSAFSEQTHANYLFEMSKTINPKYSLVSWLTILHIRFLRAMANILGHNKDKDIEEIIKLFQEDKEAKKLLWEFGRRIR